MYFVDPSQYPFLPDMLNTGCLKFAYCNDFICFCFPEYDEVIKEILSVVFKYGAGFCKPSLVQGLERRNTKSGLLLTFYTLLNK